MGTTSTRTTQQHGEKLRGEKRNNENFIGMLNWLRELYTALIAEKQLRGPAWTICAAPMI